AAGLRLRDRLWDPLAAALAGAETVLISPDGALGRLPFAALPGDSEETYLIDKYRLALVPVPQLIPVLTTPPLRNAAQRELLLLGDVDYSLRPESLDEAIADDDGTPDRPLLPSERLLAGVRAATDGSHWDRLPGGAAEVGAIRDLYERLFGLGPDQIADLRGGEATEAQFRLLAPHCFQLHLATHGFFAAPDRESALSASHLAEAEAAAGGSFSSSRRALLGFSPGLLSGLVFAGANDPPELPADGSKLTDIPDDGILTSDEIAMLPLGNVQLVVLSACETGLGESAGGEGLLGIQRAFQVSGVRSTIASLWKVSDSATRQIMAEFYSNYLKKGMSPMDALREAQLWALRNPDLRGAAPPEAELKMRRLSPRLWAAFTISGDWRR
ncbi:MAG TPA: CHAT domain-containing protein, partial [Lacipirellulaceae bacterium]|nr:CHAT domain-containing protein [Lacipirellulaceae bacterium]